MVSQEHGLLVGQGVAGGWAGGDPLCKVLQGGGRCTALGAQGATSKPPAALRSTISAVHMAEKLQLLRPTVGPMDWAIAARAAKAYGTNRGNSCGSFTMLRTMSAAVRSETDFAMLALAVFNVCHCLRVGEATSIHRADISALGWLGFYDTKTKQRWVPARLGTPVSGGGKPCWPAYSSRSVPSTCRSSRRRSWNNGCNSFCRDPPRRGAHGASPAPPPLQGL